MDGSAGVGCPGVVRLMLPIAQLLNGTHTHLIHYFCGALTYLRFKRTFHFFSSLKNLSLAIFH